MGNGKTHFDAFISYRHDSRDIAIARRLQFVLEHYHIPSKIRKLTGRKHMGHVFVDNSELSAGESLVKSINEALLNADYLIVICSPEAKASEWVNREITQFLETHDHSHILAVLSDGEPDTAFPDALRHKKEIIGTDGSNHSVEEEIELEPLAADLRCDSNRDLRQKIDVEKLRLLAAILNCRFDDLKQRDQEYRKKLIIATAAGITAVLSGFLIYSSVKNQQLQERYRQLQISESKNLAETSTELLTSGDRIRAIQVALAALPESSEKLTRPITTEAFCALNTASGAYQNNNVIQFSPERTIESSAANTVSPTHHSISPSGKFLVSADKSDTISIFRMENGELVNSFPVNKICGGEDTPLCSLYMLSDNDLIVITSGEVTDTDPETAEIKWNSQMPEGITGTEPDNLKTAVTADRSKIICANGSFAVLFNAADGKELSKQPFSDSKATEDAVCTALTVNDAGTKIAIGVFLPSEKEDESNSRLYIYDIDQGIVKTVKDADITVNAVHFQNDQRIVTFEYDISGLSSITVELRDYSLSCYDSDTGKRLWQKQGSSTVMLNDTHSGIISSPSDNVEFAYRGSDLWMFMDQDEGTPDATRMPMSGNILGVSPYDAHRMMIFINTGDIYLMSLQTDQIVKISPFTAEAGSTIGYAMFDQPLCKPVLGFNDSGKTVIEAIEKDDSITPLKTDIGALPDSYRESDQAFYDGYMSAIKTIEPELTDKECDLRALFMQAYYLSDPSNKNSATWRALIGPSSKDAQRTVLDLWKIGETEIYTSLDLGVIKQEPGHRTDLPVKVAGNTICYLSGESDGTDMLHAYDLNTKQETGKMAVLQDASLDEHPAVALKTAMDGNLYAVIYGKQSFGIVNPLSGKWVIPYGQKISEGQLQTAEMSASGKKCVFTVHKDNSDTELAIYDIDSKEWVNPEAGDTLVTNGSVVLGLKTDIAAHYQDSDLVFTDLSTGATVKKIPFPAKEHCLFNFLSSDGCILLWGDNQYIELVSLTNGKILDISQDRYSTLDCIDTDPYNNLFVLYVSGSEKYLRMFPYRVSEDYDLSLYLKELMPGAVDLKEGEMTFIDLYGNVGFYKRKSLDDCIAYAKKITGSAELSDLDKQKYNIN